MSTERPRASAEGWFAFAIVLLALWLVPAVGASADPAVTHQAWTRTRAMPPFVAAEGTLYVAATAGGEDTRVFISFEDVGDPTALTLVLQESTETGAGAAPQAATITACGLGAALTSGGEISEPPPSACRARAQATRDEAGEWRVPLAAFHSYWEAGNPVGIVLFPDTSDDPVADTATWRVAWRAAGTAITTTAPTGSPTTVVTTTASSVHAGGGVQPQQDPVTSPSIPAVAPATTVVAPSPASQVAVDDTSPVTSQHAMFVDADRPSAAAVLGVLATAGVLVLAVCARRRPEVVAAFAPSRWGGHPDTGRHVLGTAVVVLCALVPLGASEATIFKLGLVVLVAVTALGLHILLNWAGELSLAHAAFAGLPALAVAKLSADHGISAIHLLPVGVAVGAALGAAVGLPALRARGIQVAVVTLAAGIAVDRFFFTKSWLAGPAQGVTIADTTIGPLRLETQRSLWVFLVACIVLAAAAARALHGSSVGRAWRWLRADPAATAAFGIPVGRYKVAAYATAGAFAGFGGGLTVVWVERVTAQSFPTSSSFTYLIVVVLAGRGLTGGVLAAALILEGGRQFASGLAGWIDYAGPIALLVVLTRYRAGLTGIGGSLMRIVKDSRFVAAIAARDRDDTSSDEHLVTSSMVAGCVLVVLGFSAIGLAWYHIGNTDQLWIQSQELVSGGLGGMAAVILGAALLIRDQLIRNRVVVIERAVPPASTNGERPVRPLGARDEVSM